MKRTTKALAPLGVLLVLMGLLASSAVARSTAAPQNTAAPTLTGQARVGSTLTAENGTWSNSPASFAYQWQRCNADGTGCASIAGATQKTYTLQPADVDKRARVVVTATSADGSASAPSAASAVVSATDAPVETAKPVVTGTPVVGEVLTTSNGTWTGGVRSYTYQWQRCPAGAVSACVSIAGAINRTYTVRTADIGSTLRVNVTAHNASGSTATAASEMTATVGATTTTVVQTTTSVTTTTAVNRAPTIRLLSVKRVGVKVYIRYRVCDDSPGRLRIVARETKSGLSGRHVFSLAGCGVHSRSYRVAKLFRKGTVRVSVFATDRTGKISRISSRLVR